MTINKDNLNKALLLSCEVFSDDRELLEYKDYVLTLFFLKCVSDLWRAKYQFYQKTYGDDIGLIKEQINNDFYLPEQSDFYNLKNNFNDRKGYRWLISNAMHELEKENRNRFFGNSKAISFSLDQQREEEVANKIFSQLIESFAKIELDIDLFRGDEQGAIGRAYEFLIEHFAKKAGNKIDEFYTPPELSELIVELVGPLSDDEIYDPACGTGSLLIACAKQITKKDGQFSHHQLYGQEMSDVMSALAKMNLFIHDERRPWIETGDTISSPKFLDRDRGLKQFDIVVSNPPFLMGKWSHQTAENDEFNRFDFGVPPKTKGNFAFILHMLKSLKPQTGRMAVVVPDGILFRGASEEVIRKNIIEDNLLDTVIGLPKKLFYGIENSAVIMVFKKQKNDQNVLFIDASNEYGKRDKQYYLTEQAIQKIISAFKARENIRSYAHIATYDEIWKNEFNLNISRYVSLIEEEERVDLMRVRKESELLKQRFAELEEQMDQCFIELGMGRKI